MNPLRDAARRAARAAAQQAALVPDHARHHHRRRRGDRDGGDRRGRARRASSRRSPRWAPNLLIVMSGATTSGGARGGFGSLPTLTWDDLRAIQREVADGALRRAARCARPRQVVSRGPELDDAASPAPRPTTSTIRNWPVAQRRAVHASRTSTAATKVVVLGPDRRRQAVRRRAPTRSARRCASRNVPFQVVGVLARKGQSPMGQDYDDVVFIPSTTFQAKIQGGLQKYIPGTIMVERDVGATRPPRAQSADHGAAARAPPPRRRAPTTTSRSAT